MSKKNQIQRNYRAVQAMYNAHPFPNRTGIPSVKSDARYQRIYTEFLRLPIDQFENATFLDAGCGTGDVTWVWRPLLDSIVR